MAKQDLEVFSEFANCYGYAAKCAQPINSFKGGTAKPGGQSYEGDLNDYAKRLKLGVLSDGGDNVIYLSTTDVNSLVTANIPGVGDGWYLIALLVKPGGFHFVRRQGKNLFGEPFWKWKQGNGGKVERNANGGGAWVRVTNGNFPNLVKGEFLVNPPGYKDWGKIYFFKVANDGFKVTST